LTDETAAVSKFPRILSIILRMCLGLTASGAFAGDHVIIQKDKSFLQNGAPIEDIQITAGDSLTFTNNDLVTHNIYSRDPGNEFEIPKQVPGVTASVTMKTPGEVNIRCAIHPKMKLHVLVKPAGAAKSAN
jgi:plastocyanin